MLRRPIAPSNGRTCAREQLLKSSFESRIFLLLLLRNEFPSNFDARSLCNSAKYLYLFDTNCGLRPSFSSSIRTRMQMLFCDFNHKFSNLFSALRFCLSPFASMCVRQTKHKTERKVRSKPRRVLSLNIRLTMLPTHLFIGASACAHSLAIFIQYQFFRFCFFALFFVFFIYYFFLFGLLLFLLSSLCVYLFCLRAFLPLGRAQVPISCVFLLLLNEFSSFLLVFRRN